MPGEAIAEYACDKCRSRKLSCSRTQPSCRRCLEIGLNCVYTRRGVIRRSRRPRTMGSAFHLLDKHHHVSKRETSSTTSTEPRLSHLLTDIEQAGLDLTSEHQAAEPRSALDSLAETSATVWLSTADLPASDLKMKPNFCLFEDRMEEWTDLFIITLNKGQPMLFGAPDDVLDYLRNARPYRVGQRAWLVAFYGIILSHTTSTSPGDIDTKKKLISNLWLAFNDARLLVEPSEVSIQALVILAVHVEEFTSPSLSWILITNTCRMLQALGLNQRRLDPKVRERRAMLFWYLNLLDKGLAIIFARPPTFHKAMIKEIPMPSLGQLVAFRPHLSHESAPGLFGAHYLHQLMQLTCITGEVWTCLYEDVAVSATEVDVQLQKLDTWYEQATAVLNAAAMTERPFLDATSAQSIELGLRMPTFQHSYLTLLLTRSSPRLRQRGIGASTQLLSTLEMLVSDSQQVFNGVVWQLVCCPFTAFLTLFGDIVSGRQQDAQECQALLASMQQLPSFLSKMSQQNSLAAKLLPIGEVLMQHARAVVAKRSTQAAGKEVTSSLWPEDDTQSFLRDAAAISTQMHLPDDFFDWRSILADVDVTSSSLSGDAYSSANHSVVYDSSHPDTMVDWLSWDTGK